MIYDQSDIRRAILATRDLLRERQNTGERVGDFIARADDDDFVRLVTEFAQKRKAAAEAPPQKVPEHAFAGDVDFRDPKLKRGQFGLILCNGDMPGCWTCVDKGWQR